MHSEHRHAARQSLRYRAEIKLEGCEPIVCGLQDVSAAGACISVAEVGKIPDEFTLLLSHDGAAQRRCRVIWRKERENEIGVSFMAAPKGAEPAGQFAHLREQKAAKPSH